MSRAPELRQNGPTKRQAGRGFGWMALALLGVLAVNGCAEYELNAWPIYYKENDPMGIEEQPEGSSAYEVMWPFFGMVKTPDTVYHVVRPFYNWEERRDGSFEQLQFLWPLGLWKEKRDQEKEFRLLPLIYNRKRRDVASGQWQTMGFVFPLAIWSSSEKRGSAFALFPLGGVVKGILVDKFTFALFPIWSMTVHKGYRRHDVLWPFFSWGGTPDGRTDLLRIWPFYVHKEQIGEYDRYWVMWPFGLWGRQDVGTRWPKSYGGVFPFYVGKTAKDTQTGETVAYDRRFLYFLVVVRRDKRESRQLKAVAVFWPFTNFEFSRDKRDIRIWPVYWETTYKDPEVEDYRWKRYRVLWPIVWIDYDSRSLNVNTRNVIVAPFYWDRRYRWKDGETEGRDVTFWPLYTFRRDRDGSVHHWVMSHGWHDVTQGFKRNLRAFFDLFQYHSTADGKFGLRILWRLFSYDSTPGWSRVCVNPLFHIERADYGYRRWSCLLGIIKRESDGENVRWRLFYIPFGDKVKRPKP